MGIGVVIALGILARALIEGDLHPLRIFKAHAMVAPGGDDEWMNQGRPMGDQALRRGLHVRDLQSEADAPAGALPDLDVINRRSLLLVEDLQGSSAQVEHQGAALLGGPGLGRLKT